jgi:hypothetical protein
MKKIYFTTGVLAALLLSSLTTFAQLQSAKLRVNTKRSTWPIR